MNPMISVMPSSVLCSGGKDVMGSISRCIKKKKRSDAKHKGQGVAQELRNNGVRMTKPQKKAQESLTGTGGGYILGKYSTYKGMNVTVVQRLVRTETRRKRYRGLIYSSQASMPPTIDHLTCRLLLPDFSLLTSHFLLPTQNPAFATRYKQAPSSTRIPPFHHHPLDRSRWPNSCTSQLCER